MLKNHGRVVAGVALVVYVQLSKHTCVVTTFSIKRDGMFELCCIVLCFHTRNVN